MQKEFAGIAVGLALGVGIGLALDKIALGIGIGIAMAIAMGPVFRSGVVRVKLASAPLAPGPNLHHFGVR